MRAYLVLGPAQPNYCGLGVANLAVRPPVLLRSAIFFGPPCGVAPSHDFGPPSGCGLENLFVAFGPLASL